MNHLHNHVQLIGNLGRDVDFKTLADGNTLARVSLATKEIFRDKSGEKVVDVQWHQLVGWGKVAEMMQVLLEKGAAVIVRGRLVTRTLDHEDDGRKRYRTEVIVNEFVRMH